MHQLLAPGRQATGGAAIWLTWALAVRPSWIATLLLLAAFVLVPLGLGLADRPSTGPASRSLRIVRTAMVPAALAAASSFAIDPGVGAALLTVPWLVAALAVATVGLGRLATRTGVRPMLGADAALVFLAVGATWLTISRGGLRPLGFSEPIVLLTAVHFHYAGFALPLVASLAASRSGASARVPLAAMIGVPFTAIGITAGGTTEWLAATTMAGAGIATAGLLVQAAGRERRPLARGLLTVAAIALGLGMGLALSWAWSIQFGWEHLDLTAMARWHGSLNALGFGFLALLGMHLSTESPAPPGPAMMRIIRPRPAALAAIAAAASGHEPTAPAGLLDRLPPTGYTSGTWSTALPSGFDAARDALAHWSGHRAAGIGVAEPAPALAVGAVVALAIPVGPLTVLATCRIVEVIDEAGRFGFTYATLDPHPACGEESFIVKRHDDGTATFTVTVCARPAALFTRGAPALTRLAQRRAIVRYLAGVALWTPDATPIATHREGAR